MHPRIIFLQIQVHTWYGCYSRHFLPEKNTEPVHLYIQYILFTSTINNRKTTNPDENKTVTISSHSFLAKPEATINSSRDNVLTTPAVCRSEAIRFT